MVLDMILFAFMATRYVPVKTDKEEEEDTENKELHAKSNSKEINAIDNPSFKHGDDDL